MEILDGTGGGALLALPIVLRAFSGRACRRGRVQPEPGASAFCLPFGLFPLRGMGGDGRASYGYSWVLGKRWNLEATVDAGWVHAEYKRFNCPACGEYRGADKKNFLAPTRVGISLIYMLK